jgi:glycosyltransferase involved in cell wall biosynthesis
MVKRNVGPDCQCELTNIGICVVGPSPDEMQGGGVRTRALLDVLEAGGAKVTRVCHSFHKKRLKIDRGISGESSPWVTIDVPHNWPSPLKAISLVLISAYAWRVSRRSQVVLCTFGSMLFAIPAIGAAKARGKPVVLDYIDTELYGVPDRICGWFMRRADKVFAISHFLVDKATAYGCRSVLYVPTFVDTSFFRMDAAARERFRFRLGYGANDIVIGYAGSLAPFEGLPFLLQAFSGLASKYPDLRLAIVGRRLLRTDCDVVRIAADLGIGEKVRLVEPVPRADYPGLLSAFDILCVPREDCLMSRAANPIKVTEYLSMGIPVVCSAVGEMSIIITHGVNGFLAGPSDARDLERILDETVSNPVASRDVGRNGRLWVIQNYSIDKIGDRIRRSLAELVDPGDSRC